MDNVALKSAIANDIAVIKKLDPDIIPAKLYYGKWLKTMASAFWKIWLIISLTISYSYVHYHECARFYTNIWQGFFIGFFLSLLAMLAVTPSINSYILFHFHLEKRLATGVLIHQKLKIIATLFISTFVLFCTLFGSYGDPRQIVFMIVLSFFGSFGTTYFVISLELNRIGVSTVYSVIDEFFCKSTRR